MTTPPEAFDAHLAAWKEAQARPWMQLRYRIARANLARHLPDGPLQVLDAGGGNGADALPLAAAGHQVTLADYAVAMLTEARQAASNAGLADHLTTLQSTIIDLPAQLGPVRFDLILCHNVVQYMADGAGMIRALAGLLRPGGLLSLITINPISEVLRAAIVAADPAAAQALLADPALTIRTVVFDTEVRRYDLATLQDWLTEAGLTPVAHYGIRCVNDYLIDNTRKAEPAFAAALEALELALSGRDPYRQIARGTHLIARRNGATL
ncbi:MAG: methyltransferase domain-containing protein [Oscillochloris sp.]|nr:methyltransferase domain-containing protein [Oscillochloris sp.]